MEAMLKVEQLSKKYPKNPVYSLEKVDFQINQGEIVGLIGKNGAGKTTLMKMIAKSLQPTEGTILLDGKNILHQDDQLKEVGILIEPAYYKQLTVLENLHFYLAVNQQTQYKKNIRPVLELVDLWHRRKDKPGSFSFGMKQRLSLAMCLLTEPKFAIMDEPFVGLDPIGVADLIRTLKTWAQEKNMTILISSHQLAELEELCERFLFIEQGRLTQQFDKTEHVATLQIQLQQPLDQATFKKSFPKVTATETSVTLPTDSLELNSVLHYLTTHEKISRIEMQRQEELKNYFKGELS